MKKEEAKNICKKIVTTKFNNDYSIDSIDKEAIETLLNYIDNSISKEVIKEKIEDYKERMRYYQDEHIIVDDEYYRYETKVEELQELLEGR